MGLIYKHTNTINRKAYVGQTTQTMEERWGDHIYDSMRLDYKFYRALNKYGIVCWTHEIIAEYDDEILNEAEVYWIAYFDTFRSGYNSTTGGDHYEMCEETKIKISENHADVSGTNNPLFGKFHTELSKKQMSDKKKGKPALEETKKKMSKSQKKRFENDIDGELKRQLSDRWKGGLNHNFGKPRLEENF